MDRKKRCGKGLQSEQRTVPPWHDKTRAGQKKKELDLKLSALPDNEKAMLEQSGVIEEHLNTLLSKQKMLDDANDQLQRLQQEKAQHDKGAGHGHGQTD